MTHRNNETHGNPQGDRPCVQPTTGSETSTIQECVEESELPEQPCLS